jgi:uncharacterized protein (DUF3084 family)
VYAYPDVKPNRTITRVDEVLATTTIEPDERGSEAVRTLLNLLLASAFAEVQRRGSLSEGLQFDGSALNELGLALVDRTDNEPLDLQVIAVRSSDTADPVAVSVILKP